MAEDTVSAEAFERVKRERDEYKQKMGEATSALGDVAALDRFYSHFRQDRTVRDPYALAREAVKVSTLKGLAPEQEPEQLSAWLNTYRQILAAPEGEPEAKPETQPSPFQGPNPGAPGYQSRVEPMVVGGERWNEWAKEKTADEKMAAVRRGDAVPSDKVKRAQATIRTGG